MNILVGAVASLVVVAAATAAVTAVSNFTGLRGDWINTQCAVPVLRHG